MKKQSVLRPSRPRLTQTVNISQALPVKMYMDESGNGNASQPLIVGAVVSDVDADEIEAQVHKLYRRLKANRELQGFKSFDEFCRKGFHASSDPPSIAIPFYDLIQQQIGFNAVLVMTDRTTWPELPEKQQIERMYSFLVGDSLIRYREHAEMLCYIEQNDELKSLVRTLPAAAEAKALEKLGRPASLPAIKVQMLAKQSSMALAIIDYIMMAVSRWARTGYRRDITAHEYRTFRLVEPSISLLYSLEKKVISNRRVRSGQS